MLLNSIRLRELYQNIQNEIFNLIPEKWDKIYLYASVSKKINNIETGEMFFYYFPKGILRKNPVNVYEVPNKFNIEEKSYLKAVDMLYGTIKKLKYEFLKQADEDELWNSITILIENNKFTIRYSFENFLGSKYTSYDRHIIWKHEYLDMPAGILNRKDRKMLEEYYEDVRKKNVRQEEYQEGIYTKVHNFIEYDKQDNINDEDEILNQTIKEEKKKKSKNIIDKNEEELVTTTNQILKFN